MSQLQSIQPTSSPWSGGVCPFNAGWRKTMMWIFIITDGLLFASFLAGYGFVRLASPTWPDRAAIFHMEFITAMTFVLITSSVTMACAVTASRQGKRSLATKLLLATALGGLVFLAMQAYEWSAVIGQGGRLASNPWGVPLFTTCFFLITGFHGSHVLSGLIVLVVTAARNASGKTQPEGVEVAGLYWHFVDLVWVLIFTFFYLI
jgi:cytochrome c oxidase subunit 3